MSTITSRTAGLFHLMRAEKELFSLLCEYEIPNVIFHWYSGSANLVPAIVERGFYFSVNEAMCLSNNGRQIISRIPEDRMLTETVVPYNKKCDIPQLLAAIGVGQDIVYNNFKRLVNRAAVKLTSESGLK